MQSAMGGCRDSVAEKLPDSLASIRIFVTAVVAVVFHRLACPKHFLTHGK